LFRVTDQRFLHRGIHLLGIDGAGDAVAVGGALLLGLVLGLAHIVMVNPLVVLATRPMVMAKHG